MLYRITAKELFVNERVVIEVRPTLNSFTAFTHKVRPFLGSLFDTRDAAIAALGCVAKDLSPSVTDFRVERYEGSLVGVTFDPYEIEAIKYFENLTK